ncbi:hypothetical protein G0Q06_10065 [Puniceicoccales bacterium CK1056]|uniref:PEP-CTERM sorting domain-containing protein n=1 Tax=Oceanipulchritudo coccoides TaxID=2706888 RepID=A0A6B2M4M6_9BACT|nr:hypothetical protein [Oceanipulchritudo coccoides]NDV62795.1 hypothetical protein [Oceanipulchritudo coccoides]
MKNTITLLTTAITLAGFSVTSQATTVLIDFGYDATFRGVSVINPDENGNDWNSVGPGNFFPDLVDKTGAVTSLAFGPDAPAMNTDSYNGPAGNTDPNGDFAIGDGQLPEDSEYDAFALGDLGADEAVYDYIVGRLDTGDGRFQIQGLDPAVSYTLKFYGGKKYMDIATDGITRYNVYDDPDYTNLVGTVDLSVGGIGAEHNQNLVGTISGISPAEDVGIFYIEFGDSISGLPGYLNCMSVSFDEVIADTWAGYPIGPDGYVNTGSFLGWIYVRGTGDFIWSVDQGKYIYLPEALVSGSGAWSYTPR